MPYFKNSLISRAPSGGMAGALAGFTDTVGDVAKGALSFFGAQQRAAGALEATNATNAQLMAQQQAKSGGISTQTLLIGGAAAAAVAFLVLRKKG